jgi:hypothetical protein
VATLKQILDCPKFWNFHKPTPNCKPRPPIDAKHYLDHSHKVFWPNSKSNDDLAMLTMMST